MQTFTSQENSRINKAIAQAGICSRREADKLIESRKVFINDKLAVMGSKVQAGDVVRITTEAKDLRYALYYKPVGEVTDTKDGKDMLRDLHPIGRLDKDSEGLLIYTNDHRLVDYLLSPKNNIEKEYHVRVRETPTPRVERILMQGITTQEGEYAPVKKVVLIPDNKEVQITLTEGKKHEIRRMLNALNLTITSLKRVRIAHIKLPRMRPGQAKALTEKELSTLLANL